MKINIPIMLILFLLFSGAANAETVTEKGLEIEVNIGESEFGDILEFIVKAKNTTTQEKTLLGTIYLDPDTYKDMAEEDRTTPVYLELPPGESAMDIFYLIAAYEVSSPTWFFRVDEVYDFIIDENTEFEDHPDADDEIEYEMEEDMENNDFSITGFWKMEKNEDSSMYSNWSYLFKEDGSVIIDEVLFAEARMPEHYEGTYEIKGNEVLITLDFGNRLPGSFTIRGDRLVAEEVFLIKTSDDTSIL